MTTVILAKIYLFKFNNKKQKQKICSKLKIKTLKQRKKRTSKQPHWRCFSVFIVKFEHNSYYFLVFLMLSVNMYSLA